MLLINSDIENRLIKGQTVSTSYSQFAQVSVRKYMPLIPMKKSVIKLKKMHCLNMNVLNGMIYFLHYCIWQSNK